MAENELLPLLLLKESGDNRIDGSTRFQKLVFLAQNEPEPPLAKDYQYDYYSHKYGPFSKELADDLDELDDQDLIDVDAQRTPKGKKYVYRLTEDGQEKAEELESELRERFGESDIGRKMANEKIGDLEHIEKVFNNMPLSNLLEYVYNHYEEYTTESELDIS